MSDDLVIPDTIEPVLGWRCWRVNNGVIRSVHAVVDWQPRVAHEAVCNRRSYQLPMGPFPGAHQLFGPAHLAPHEGCSCGIYAGNEERIALNIATTYSAHLVGRVAMWGKVIEYDKGWRAQYAYPVELKALRGMAKAAREGLEKRYGIEVGEWTIPIAKGLLGA